MKALSTKTKYGSNIRGRVAQFFSMKDDSNTTYLAETLGGITMFLSSLSLFANGGGATEIAMECQNRSAVVSDDVKTRDAMAFALVSGLATLCMGIFAKVPIVIGPGLPFGISFRKLMCTSPSLGRDGGLAANLIVGCVFLVMVTLAKLMRGFVAIPEDFRLGMAAGIASLICTVAIIEARIATLALLPTPNWDEYSFHNMTLTEQDDILRIPIVACLGMILIVLVQVRFKRRLDIAWSMLAIIFAMALLSDILRASIEPATFAEMLSPARVATGSKSQIGTVPNFSTWTAQNGFVLFRYMVIQSVEKLFDSFATVTAIALLLVVTNLGYNKSVFVNAMNDSDKIAKALLVDAVGNVVIAPFLGTVLVTPFIESVAGIIAGTKTGFGAVVTGVLYLALSPVIQQVIWLFPAESVNPGIIYGSIFAVRSIQYLDFRRPTLFFPSLLAFILIQMSFEIGLSSSVSYIILFFTWFASKYWICITPQMVIAFGLSILLIIARATFTKSIQGLAIAIALVVIICLVFFAALFIPHNRKLLKIIHGNKEADRYFEDENSSFLGGGGSSGTAPGGLQQAQQERKRRRTSMSAVIESSAKVAQMVRRRSPTSKMSKKRSMLSSETAGSDQPGDAEEQVARKKPAATANANGLVRRASPWQVENDNFDEGDDEEKQGEGRDGTGNGASSFEGALHEDAIPEGDEEEVDEVAPDAIVRQDEPMGESSEDEAETNRGLRHHRRRQHAAEEDDSVPVMNEDERGGTNNTGSDHKQSITSTGSLALT